MKKYLAGFILGTLLATGLTVFADEVKSLIAEKATFEVFVGNEKFESDKPIAVINGSTYLPLKDTGEVLGVPVEWNEKYRRVEVGEMKEAEPTVILVPTSTPTSMSTPIKTQTPTISAGKEVVQKWYDFRSEITANEDGFPMITKDGEYYLPLGLFGDNLVYPPERPKDGIFSVQLPGKYPVPAQEDNSLKHEGRTFIKLSSVGLKARIEGNTVYIEWAD